MLVVLAVSVSPTRAVPAMAGAPVAAEFWTETVTSSELDSILPSPVQMAPSCASQSVVTETARWSRRPVAGRPER